MTEIYLHPDEMEWLKRLVRALEHIAEKGVKCEVTVVDTVNVETSREERVADDEAEGKGNEAWQRFLKHKEALEKVEARKQ